MSGEPIDVLVNFALRLRKKVSRCKAYDANVCRWTKTSYKPWELVPIEGEPFSHRLQFISNGSKIRLLANNTFVQVEVAGDFGVESISINRQETNGFFPSEYAGVQLFGGKEYSVFTRDGKLSLEQIILLGSHYFSILIEQSDLKENEMVCINGGAVTLYLVRPTLDHLTQLADSAIALAQQFKPRREDRHLEKLPSQFHPIIPLIEKWAVSDDQEREEALENSSKLVLRSLVDEVAPYLKSVDAYLDSFAGEPPEQAAALGRLAELAVEASRKLSKQFG